MIPFADLVNHQSYVESFYGDNDEGPFECWATECFGPGEELFQSYGSHKSSAHFFLYYGFVPRGYVRSDYITFGVPEDEIMAVYNSTTHRDAGTKKLAKDLVDDYSHTLTGFAGVDGVVNEQFIEAYRDLLNYTNVISSTDLNETAGKKTTLQHLLSGVSNQIAGYPTTYAQDFEKLVGDFDTYDKWVTLTVRTRMKFVLLKVQENLAHRLATDPANTTAWEKPDMDWLIVNDEDEVTVGNPTHNIKESLSLINLPLPEALPPFVDGLASGSF